ncbi:hypothetical protein QBC46DRAFT_403552 [Diplogelasinospora grovesii]|uniref:Uncharacterized protein n=1 Tax=Diplogelasinospora grovesii TaxID=303347 RepID=A0AAN6NGI2_9PEZI|nr:hypothetical protein QBC46DRAFT_403552 [Diplogelasinospora grovesii]
MVTTLCTMLVVIFLTLSENIEAVISMHTSVQRRPAKIPAWLNRRKDAVSGERPLWLAGLMILLCRRSDMVTNGSAQIYQFENGKPKLDPIQLAEAAESAQQR